MAEIGVSLYGIFAEIARKKNDTVTLNQPALALEDLVRALEARYGSRFGQLVWDSQKLGLSPSVIVLLNKEPVSSMNASLAPGTEVSFFTAFGAG